jgi:hypothetical protein
MTSETRGRVCGVIVCALMGGLVAVLPPVLKAQTLASVGIHGQRSALAPIGRTCCTEPGGERVGSNVALMPALAFRSTAAPKQTPRPRWWAPFVSAAVPGTGQAAFGQDRFVLYLAVEGYSWLRFGADAREGRRQRTTYRDLARTVARAYVSDSAPDGEFEYYERMEHFVESGAYWRLSVGEFEPEIDTATFNGSLWLRARKTFWANPDEPPARTSRAYIDAIEYYASRAITPEYRWSWRNAQLEQDLFRRTIARSNDAFRSSLRDLGVIIANHALSTVDAYVSFRLRYLRPTDPTPRLEVSVPWPSRLGGGPVRRPR